MRARQHWLALLVAVAVVALSVWAVVALRASSSVDEGPVSIRQVERAELQRQGLTGYEDLSRVRGSRQRLGDTSAGVPSQRDVWEMELNELRRSRLRVPAATRPDVEAGIRRLEDRVGSSTDE